MSKKSEIFTAHIKIFRYKDTCTLFSLIPLITFTMVKFFKGLSYFFFLFTCQREKCEYMFNDALLGCLQC